MITSKECTDCHKTKKVSNYYIHRDNKIGHGLDFTCKECSRKIAKDLQGLKDYCEMNCRKFSQELYDSIEKAINDKLKNDIEFNSLSEEKRESFLFKKTVKLYFSRMGQPQYYSYVNTDARTNSIINQENEDVEDFEELEPIDNKEKKIWSEKWQGKYTQRQIDWLDAYYEDTCADFTVKTRNHKDYVRKIAKASLAMDEAYNDMMNGVEGADKKYDKAKSIFDSLSQSAKLSEKTRSGNDVVGLGSLGEVVAKLEKTGFLQKKIEFEKDDIDKINEDMRYVLSSAGGDI